jgi:hypothetical protein
MGLWELAAQWALGATKLALQCLYGDPALRIITFRRELYLTPLLRSRRDLYKHLITRRKYALTVRHVSFRMGRGLRMSLCSGLLKLLKHPQGIWNQDALDDSAWQGSYKFVERLLAQTCEIAQQQANLINLWSQGIKHYVSQGQRVREVSLILGIKDQVRKTWRLVSLRLLLLCLAEGFLKARSRVGIKHDANSVLCSTAQTDQVQFLIKAFCKAPDA